jgi:hypothetical protein
MSITLELKRFCNFVRSIPQYGIIRSWEIYLLVHTLYPWLGRGDH